MNVKNVKTDKIELKKINETFMEVITTPNIEMELFEYLSYYAKDYRFMPAYKAKRWDGKIRLFDPLKKTTYCGLVDHIEMFAKTRNYEIIVDPKLKMRINITPKDVFHFVQKINLPDEYKVRDYQYLAVYNMIKNMRTIILSPTSSGKSLIIYLAIRFIENLINKKILIVVPRLSLLYQMKSDFEDYSRKNNWDVDYHVGLLGDNNRPKQHNKIVISTWQSIFRKNKAFFDNFEALVIDECHMLQSSMAKSIRRIADLSTNCKFRLGTTGTIDDLQVSIVLLQSALGKIVRVITTKDLMDRGEVAKLKIIGVRLKYPIEESKIVIKKKYSEQVKYINEHKKRLDFIAKLALSQSKNCLVLFSYVNYGKKLVEKIKQLDNKRKVYLIYGEIDGKIREQIRKIVENEQNSIIVASYGTFSTGVSIKNIHSIIFSTAYKSKITTLQSIGRGLRLGKNKSSVVLFDVFDDFKVGKRENYSLQHFKKRVEFYNREKFDFQIKTINM